MDSPPKADAACAVGSVICLRHCLQPPHPMLDLNTKKRGSSTCTVLGGDGGRAAVRKDDGTGRLSAEEPREREDSWSSSCFSVMAPVLPTELTALQTCASHSLMDSVWGMLRGFQSPVCGDQGSRSQGNTYLLLWRVTYRA